MPDRSLTYRIIIDSSSAKAQARNVRAAFESELRSIKVGQLDTSGLKSATAQAKLLTAELERAAKAGDLGQIDTSGLARASSEAQRLRHELEQAVSAANNIKPPASGGGAASGGLQTLAGGVLGGVVAGSAIRGLQELGKEVVELGRRGAVFNQLGDVLGDYARSVGTSAEAMLSAATKASQGTISQFELILNANRAIQFEVAKTPESFAKLIELSTALGRAQGIADTQALEFLTTGLARESRLILDNLGLIINLDEATSKYAESIGKTADQLSTAERKQALLDEAFRQGAVAIEANRDAVDSAATQFERLDANTQNLKDIMGELIAQNSAAFIKTLADALGGAVEVLEGKGQTPEWLTDMGRQLQETGEGMNATTLQGLLMAKMLEAVGMSVRGLDEEERRLLGGTSAATQMFLEQEGVLTNLGLELSMTAHRAKSAGSEMLQMISDQEQAIGKGLLSKAQGAVETLGVDRALALYQQAKKDADAAIQGLVDAGITDAVEFGLRSEKILLDLSATFDEVSQIDFSQLSTAFSSLDVGFVDFLPSVASARSELAALSTEIAYSGIATAEQGAQFEYLSMVAYSVGDATSQLGQVTAELGYEFLASNEYAAALVDQLYQAEASFRAGLISADVYAGVTAVLSGQLLGLAQSAGIATNAIYALNQSQADMASAGGLAIGGNIANRVQSQQGERARDHNRREMERFNRETERAAKSAAKHTETAARGAAKTLESGAKKAAKALESALRGVEGLFDPSQVNDKDIEAAKLGTYVDKADEYLRRLRDEVENGVDWADVSIDDARAALEKVGIKAGDSAQAILKQFEDAWGSSVLFSDKSNLSFINKEAVQLQQDLSDKAAQGEKNILEYFGVVVDDAIDAVTGGGGGGGASYTPPEITPPDLIDVDPITEGLQTGLDDVVARTGENIKQSLAGTEAAFFGGFDSFLGGNKAGAKRDFIGPLPKEITITADSSAQALTPYLSTVAQGPATAPLPTVIAPTIDAVSFQAEIDKLQAQITVTLPDDAAQTIALALGDQLSTQVETFKSQGAVIGEIIKGGIGQAVALGAKGEVQIDIAGYVAGNLSAQAETFTNQGKGIATLLQSGIAQGFNGEGQATGEGQGNAITPLLTNINTQIRSSTEGIKREGATVAQILIAGMIAHFQAGQAAGGGEGGEAGGGTPFASALMTNLSTQFTTTSNMFYAVGFIPAGHVEDGFKGYVYEGLAESFMTKLTTEIRSNADNLGQRGGTMAGYVQSGFVTAFSSETFKAQLIAIGELMYSYLEIGILARVNGGALTNAIAAKVVEDITVELEQP